MSLTLYIVRHGERLDQVDSTFAYTSPSPYDPPLTILGKKQAKKSGSYIHDLQLENVENQNNKLEYILIASPFLRTTDTAIGIAEGIAADSKKSDAIENIKKRPFDIKLCIDPSLSEWHTSIYFSNPVPNSIVTLRFDELHKLFKNEEQKEQKSFEVDWSYKPVSSELPKYPEGIQDVLTRCTSSMEHILEPYVKDLSLNINKDKDIVLIIVTHGWCFNVIQEACAKTSNWKNAEYCAVTRARWIPKSENNNDAVQIIITEDEDDNKSVRHDKPKLESLTEYGEFDLDIISTINHLEGLSANE